MPKILIIEDDAAFCEMLQKFISKHGHEAVGSFTALDAKAKMKQMDFDLVLTDLRLPDDDGITLLSDIKKINQNIPVIVMTGYAEVGTAVTAMKKGAFDYISKPFTPEEILMLISNAISTSNSPLSKNEGSSIKTRAVQAIDNDVVHGVSKASEILNEYIALVSPTDMSVLLTGESGTGKEVAARTIHDRSKRKQFPFVAVDCGAIPKEIAPSEFFGHIKGSFTGAIEDKIGHFEAANKGTLFLDEIGNLSYGNQVQLLRALQERKIKRIGSTAEISVDVRIISATNEDLLDAVDKGNFREDLYHRLNEFSIEIPSLKARSEDLLLFAAYFLETANRSLDKNILGFSPAVLEVFKEYHWPGNIRELQNVIKRAVLLTTGDIVETSALPKEVTHSEREKGRSEDFSKDAYEKDQILKALKRTNFNKSKAAQLLQVTRKTLYNKISHYKLDL